MFTTLPYREVFDIPVILTMHDIQQEYYPEFFSKEVLENRRLSFRPSAEKADHIIAISEFTKKTLIEKYGIQEDKISVVYNGYDEKRFKKLEIDTIKKFRAKYNLPEKFIMYNAATWGHKNHINLLRALQILKDKYSFREKLILTGIKKGNYKAVKNEINKLGLKRDVIYLGYLPYDELPALFNAANMLVFPSLFEGFGIPVVEAMAVGLPIACSNTTSLPEVAGDAALYFNPDKPEDIADKVFTLHKNDGLRNTLVQRGLERAELFTWKRTAEETLKVYEKVYRNLNPLCNVDKELEN
jgi:glycosyltransferase involved in cell wall biosynthesis